MRTDFNPNLVIALFTSPKQYVAWTKLMTDGGATVDIIAPFTHEVTIADIKVISYLHLHRLFELQSFLSKHSKPIWIMCKDFHPDEMEMNYLKSRINEHGSISSGDLFIICPDKLKPEMRLFQ